MRHILKALDRDDVKVPRNNVMNLLAVLELLAERQPAHQWDYAAALILYARNPDAAAENRFRILTGSPSVPIAEAAAQGLEILAGISSQAAAAAAFHERGYARMTRSQQVYHAIAEYRDEVNNGGHDQFFRNSSGELCDTVIEGLRLVGSPSKAAILSGARGAFAPFPPAKGQEERCNQMEAFGPRQIEILRTADKSFGYSEQRPGERLTVLLTLYALQHKRDFATPRSAPKAAAPPAAR